eukprot:jgi/Orpsp1_1/1185681/evm.model.c7180000094836.2
MPLKEASEYLGSEDQRIKLQKEIRNKKLEIIQLATTEAKKNMFEEKYELAIPAALQALRYSQDVYKKKSIESIPSYLLLGKATTGLKNFKQAEDYLLLAKYALFKSKKKGYKIRYQLHRNLGILYTFKKQYKEALLELSNDIYYSSLLHGPEHICVSGGYFQLGNVFYYQQKYNNALSAYSHVINIWNSYFKEKNSEVFDEALQAEAQNMFTRILEIREELLPESKKNIELAEVYMAFGQLHYITKKYIDAKNNFEEALKRYQLEYSNSNINIIQIKSFLREIELNI